MYLLPISLIVSAVFLAIVLLIYENKKSKFSDIKIKEKKSRNKSDRSTNKYIFYKKMPVVNLLLKKCLNKINSSPKIKDRHREEAVKIVKIAIVTFIFASILISPFISNVRILIASIIGLVFISLSTIDYLSSKIKTKLLNHFIDFLDILRNKYFESGYMIDEALSESIQSLDIDRHKDIIDEAEILLETIENPDSDLALRDYYQLAPNKYFILLAGLLFISKENGDLIDEKGSRFANSLSELSSELKEETKLRDRLNFSLKSLNIIAIIPLFVLSPLRTWSSNSFYPLEKFYDSSLGFISEFIVLLAVIFSFIALNKIQTYREESLDNKLDRSLEKIYKNFSRIIDYIKPSKDSSRYNRIKNKRDAALDFSSIEIHYSKKLFFSLITCLLCILVFIYSAEISKKAILENPTLPSGYLGGEVNKEILEEAKNRSKIDKEMILLLDEGETADTIIKKLENKYGLLGENKNTAIERIINKYKDYEASKFNYKDIIYTYLISFFGFFAPDLLLLFRKRMILIDSMNEIGKFQLICSLMMHIKQMSVDNLLEWLERFSFIYQKPIQEAIMDYDYGAEEALTKLKNSNENDEFRKLVDHILSAVNNISLNKAFDDLESEKNYYREKREIINERIVQKKIQIGKIIGFTPIYSVIIVYFMFPLIYASMNEIDMYFKMFTM